MDLRAYFEGARGQGFLATAGRDGQVDVAVYSRPRVLEDGTLVFGMTDRLTHAHVAQNPHATYAFHEGRFQGVRLYLEKVGEETEGSLLEEIRARADEVVGPGVGDRVRFAVRFRVRKVLPLVGDGSVP